MNLQVSSQLQVCLVICDAVQNLLATRLAIAPSCLTCSSCPTAHTPLGLVGPTTMP